MEYVCVCVCVCVWHFRHSDDVFDGNVCTDAQLSGEHSCPVHMLCALQTSMWACACVAAQRFVGNISNFWLLAAAGGLGAFSIIVLSFDDFTCAAQQPRSSTSRMRSSPAMTSTRPPSRRRAAWVSW